MLLCLSEQALISRKCLKEIKCTVSILFCSGMLQRTSISGPSGFCIMLLPLQWSVHGGLRTNGAVVVGVWGVCGGLGVGAGGLVVWASFNNNIALCHSKDVGAQGLCGPDALDVCLSVCLLSLCLSVCLSVILFFFLSAKKKKRSDVDRQMRVKNLVQNEMKTWEKKKK